MAIVCARDEPWTGLGLDWIRNIANFVQFGLDTDCKTLQNFGSGPDLDLVNGKQMRHFCCEKAAFVKYFRLDLYLDFAFEKLLGLCLDLGWVLKKQAGSGSQNMTVRSSLQCACAAKTMPPPSVILSSLPWIVHVPKWIKKAWQQFAWQRN